MSLAALPTKLLLDEISRRLECATKKERRTIFIGQRNRTKCNLPLPNSEYFNQVLRVAEKEHNLQF